MSIREKLRQRKLAKQKKKEEDEKFEEWLGQEIAKCFEVDIPEPDPARLEELKKKMEELHSKDKKKRKKTK